MTLRPSSLCFLVSALLFGACGDDDSSSKPKAEEVIPAVTLAVRPADAPTDPSLPAEWIPCNGAMVASLGVENWRLQAPDSCGETVRCGHVVVRASSVNATPVTVRAITTTALVSLVPAADWAGTVEFVAQLSLDDGKAYRTAEGATIETTLSLDLPLKAGCAPTPAEGGTGGSAGGGGTAGTSANDSGAPNTHE